MECENKMKEMYEKMDDTKKLIVNLMNLTHRMRFTLDRKGGQKRVLKMLLENGEMGQRELTERLGIQPGSASETLRKLEDAGLIYRVTSAEDRRTVNVILTKDGKLLAESAKEEEATRNDGLFDALSADEKATLLSLLERVNNDWEAKFPGSARPHMPRHHRCEGKGPHCRGNGPHHHEAGPHFREFGPKHA